jgi:hypothetical protein
VKNLGYVLWKKDPRGRLSFFQNAKGLLSLIFNGWFIPKTALSASIIKIPSHPLSFKMEILILGASRALHRIIGEDL